MEETKIDSVDKSVRAVVTLGLTAGFMWGFWADRISGEVFTAVFSGVVGYWFASRQAQQSQKDAAVTAATAAASTAALVTGTGSGSAGPAAATQMAAARTQQAAADTQMDAAQRAAKDP